MNSKKTLCLALAAGLAFSGLALAQTAGEVRLKVEEHDEYGEYLTDGQGRALYLFTSDTQEEGSSQAASSCQDQCAEAWPPLIVQGTPQVGEDLEQDRVGTLQRTDGQTQVTYGGWPLYYFAKDQQSGQVTGHDVKGFGGEWYLVSPEGEKVDE